jgi:predicted membrane protein
MRRLGLATSLLSINGILLLYYAYTWSSMVYLAFALFSLLLAYGVGQENKTAIKVAIIYAGIEFFFALLFLIAGNLYSAIDAAISFFILHDILGYIQQVYREEHPEEFKKESEEEREKAEASNQEGGSESEGKSR